MTKIISISLTKEDAQFIEEYKIRATAVFREAIHNLRIAGRLDVFRENQELKEKVEKLASIIQSQQERLSSIEGGQ